ncbi:MAG: DUF1016 N-terminal domain-containing protein [Bacteroidota bacterium]
MKFDFLISRISDLDGSLRDEANKAVNKLLTIRNWLIGYYIVEYAQEGEDRAKYGSSLLKDISDRINKDGFSHRNLKIFRQFYLSFPLFSRVIQRFGIGQTLSAQFRNSPTEAIRQTSAQFKKEFFRHCLKNHEKI